MQELADVLWTVPVTVEPRAELKKQVPQAVGLIRRGDTTPYANLILESE